MTNRLMLAALALTVALFSAAPAFAYWGPHYGVSIGYYGGYGYPGYYPPAYVYAPPPAVVYEQPPAQVIYTQPTTTVVQPAPAAAPGTFTTPSGQQCRETSAGHTVCLQSDGTWH